MTLDAQGRPTAHLVNYDVSHPAACRIIPPDPALAARAVVLAPEGQADIRVQPQAGAVELSNLPIYTLVRFTS